MKRPASRPTAPGKSPANRRCRKIVDARGAVIEFDIYVLDDTGYRLQPLVDGWRRSVVFGDRFRFERARDAAGGWQYTLDAL